VYLNAVLDVLVVLGDNVEPVEVEVLKELRQGEGVLSPVGVFDSEEGVDLVVDLVSEEEVGLGEDTVCDVVGDHVAKSALVVSDEGAVVYGEVGIVLVEIGSEPPVGTAVLADVVSTQSEAGVRKGFVSVEGCVKIPVFVALGDDAVVELQLEVVSRLHLSEQGPALGKTEPEFELVSKFIASLVGLDVGLEVESAGGALGVDLPGEELVVDEVVGEDGVGLSGEVCPGVDFDAFGL
jgi:hypothetical protein